jgi:C_GCAxxG_C_C family probable redox protein
MDRIDIADKKFHEGFNCAQSVLYAYANAVGFPDDTALRIANGFGGGMGRKQEVCGAVTGAIMVIGLIYGRGANDGRERHENTYQKVQQFIDSFSNVHSTINCRKLLSGCCLSSVEGQKAFKENELIEQCYEYVRTACRILESMNVTRDLPQ